MRPWKASVAGGFPHEYTLVEDEESRGLAKLINESKDSETWSGNKMRVLFKGGYKYWLLWPVINRRSIKLDETMKRDGFNGMPLPLG